MIVQIQKPLLRLVDAAANMLDAATDDQESTASLWREAWVGFDAAYLAARKDIYYPSDPQTASPLTAESLLTLNAFIFNLRAIGRALVVEAESDDYVSSDKTASAPGGVAGDVEMPSTASTPARAAQQSPPSHSASSPAAHGALARSWLHFIFCDSAVAKGAPPKEAGKIALAMAISAAIDHALLTSPAYEGQPAITAFTVVAPC